MKAHELKVKPLTLEKIYESIRLNNETEPSSHKHFIPHFLKLDSNVVESLVLDGFKVQQGEWMRGDFGLIIEW